jgi:flotillin
LRTAHLKKKVQSAKALEESYVANKSRGRSCRRERSTQNANVVIPAAKQKAIIDAQAEAEKTRELAKGS